jgi:dCTP deaminase
LILSAQSIRFLCTKGPPQLISPFNERTREHGMTFGLSACGYDVRIAQDLALWGGQFQLASTIEHFYMPRDLVGFVTHKSTWRRRGLDVGAGTVIEPGWHGYLTLELVNDGSSRLYIAKGMPIAQIIFHRLDEETVQPYEGKYQDQPEGPVEAIYDKRSD